MAAKKSDEMPFLDHLEELRWRLVRSIAALGVGLVIGAIIVVHYNAILFLEKPILPYLHGQKLMILHPADSFSIVMSASLVIGSIIALPVIAYQLWGFLAPALHKHEKRLVLPVVVVGTLLFACGVALAYFFVLPLALAYLMTLESSALTPMIVASEYFSFVTTLCVAFGAVFELPLAISGLTALGIVKPQFLSKYRRHAIVACWVVAAVVTPGDFLGTTLALAIPLYLLFEVSVVLSYVIHRRRERRHAAIMAEGRRGRSPRMKRWWVVAALAALAAAPAPMRAQGRPVRPAGRGAGADTRAGLPGDTTRRDSVGAAHWSPADSVMNALMARKGYTVTRYEGAHAQLRRAHPGSRPRGRGRQEGGRAARRTRP